MYIYVCMFAVFRKKMYVPNRVLPIKFFVVLVPNLMIIWCRCQRAAANISYKMYVEARLFMLVFCGVHRSVTCLSSECLDAVHIYTSFFF